MMPIWDMLFIFISKSTTHLVLAKAAPRGLEPGLDVVAYVHGGIMNGSGQATPLPIALAESARKTVLIQSWHVGVTCVNEGCSPTKTMIERKSCVSRSPFRQE